MTKMRWFVWSVALMVNFVLTFGVATVGVRSTPLGENAIAAGWLIIGFAPLLGEYRKFQREIFEIRRRILRLAWHICFFPAIGLGLLAANLSSPPADLVRAAIGFAIATGILTIPLYPLEARVAYEKSGVERRYKIWIEREP